MAKKHKDNNTKCLVIGWDGADWKAINPLLDAGLMPNLEKLINRGVIADLRTLDPPLSPMLWTSISTGKRPYQHGIHGFSEYDETIKSVQPVHVTSRTCRAIWNILSHKGYKTHQIGWWPSHPAEPINGISISNFYQKSPRDLSKEWTLPEHAIHPPEKTDLYSTFRIHPTELTGAHLLPFVPKAGEIDQSLDRRLYSVASITAECSTIHAAATYLLEHEEWNFLGVYYDSIDHYGHGFMKYNPPKRKHIDQESYDKYNNVVTAGYRYHDMMLGRLMELIPEETYVMLISDHGFSPDHRRPDKLPKEPAGPAEEHSDQGIFCLAGPGIRKDERIYGASILDITPTVLALFGLPVGQDMDGKVLIQAWKEKFVVDAIPSWDKVKGNFYEHSTQRRLSKGTNEAMLQQLVDLGYIEPVDGDIEKVKEKTIRENEFYLSRSYIDGGKFKEGLSLLESLHGRYPKERRYGNRFLTTLIHVRDFTKARKVLDGMKEAGKSQSVLYDYLEGLICSAEGRNHKAKELYDRVLADAQPHPNILVAVATLHLQSGDLNKSLEFVEKAITLDDQYAHAYFTKGKILLEALHYEEAIISFLTTIGLHYYSPHAHYYLGMALLKSKRYEEAADAFQVTIKLAPGINRARQLLAQIYNKHIPDPDKLRELKVSQNEPHYQGSVTVVSGLPRSGTSAMMQMLSAGGLDVLTDGTREADENNKKGYLELEAVKNLKKDKRVIAAAKDKVVKVVSPLLQHLPPQFYYKIIMMERDVDEILLSQEKMLKREKRDVQDKDILRKKYIALQQSIKNWANKSINVEVININYNELILEPMLVAFRIQEFLDRSLDLQSMAAVIDEKLYRERLTRS